MMDEHRERIRNHLPEEHMPDGPPGRHDLIHHAHDADDFGAQHHRHKLRAPMVRTIFEVIRLLSKVTAPECSRTYIRPRSWGNPADSNNCRSCRATLYNAANRMDDVANHDVTGLPR